MAKSTYERKEWQNIPEGVEELKFAAVVDVMGKEFDSGAPKKQKKLNWESDITGADGWPLRISQWANDTFAPKSKLRAIATALNNGRDPGDSIDWDDYIGRRALIIVKHVHDENTGHTYARVAEVLRLPGAAENAEAARVAQATARVKEQGRRSHTATALLPEPIDNAQITDEDIPF
jgi:hypothetical protein